MRNAPSEKGAELAMGAERNLTSSMDKKPNGTAHKIVKVFC